LAPASRKGPASAASDKGVARRSRRRRIVAVLLVGVGVIAGAVLTVFAMLRWFAEVPGPSLAARVAVSWPEGLDEREAAQLLTDLGLVSQPRAMELFLRAKGGTGCFIAGPHLLPLQASPQQLLWYLCRSDERPVVKVTFPEGYTRFAMAQRLEDLGVMAAAAFLHASADPTTLHAAEIDRAGDPVADTAEGYLFPATYKLGENSDPRQVVRLLASHMLRRFAQLAKQHPAGLAELQDDLGLDRRGILTLASMVEKEAAVPEERPIIASVFINRLRDPEFKRLQSDPTAVYGCYAMPEQIPACRGFEGKATRAINSDPQNRFSTYVVDGLPPGPIANPGAASLEAVLQPAPTKFLYFVAQGAGRHAFSETLEQHNAAVRRWRERRRDAAAGP